MHRLQKMGVAVLSACYSVMSVGDICSFRDVDNSQLLQASMIAGTATTLTFLASDPQDYIHQVPLDHRLTIEFTGQAPDVCTVPLIELIDGSGQLVPLVVVHKNQVVSDLLQDGRFWSELQVQPRSGILVSDSRYQLFFQGQKVATFVTSPNVMHGQLVSMEPLRMALPHLPFQSSYAGIDIEYGGLNAFVDRLLFQDINYFYDWTAVSAVEDTGFLPAYLMVKGYLCLYFASLCYPTVTYGVDFYRLVYYSALPTGEAVKLSAMVAQPTKTNVLFASPVVLWAHGTIPSIEAPSHGNLFDGLMATFLGAKGYSVVVPDMLGHGLTSHLPSSYGHSRVRGHELMDALRAFNESRSVENFQPDDSHSLYLIGLDEGVNNLLSALHEGIDKNWLVESTYFLSGGYSLSEQITSYMHSMVNPEYENSFVFPEYYRFRRLPQTILNKIAISSEAYLGISPTVTQELLSFGYEGVSPYEASRYLSGEWLNFHWRLLASQALSEIDYPTLTEPLRMNVYHYFRGPLYSGENANKFIHYFAGSSSYDVGYRNCYEDSQYALSGHQLAISDNMPVYLHAICSSYLMSDLLEDLLPDFS